jgi:F-type H+-transporting ATPase subunit epsilon
MAEASGKKLHVVVVTPERAVVDESADMVILPMYDGELGVLPGRAALVGQLGPGVVRFTAGGVTRRFFVDGGFGQVRADTVTVLTPKAWTEAELTPDAASRALAAAEAMPNTNPVERVAREKAVARGQVMVRVAKQFVHVETIAEVRAQMAAAH